MNKPIGNIVTAVIYYWKNSKYIDGEIIPSKTNFAKDYAPVFSFSVRQNKETLENLFRIFNEDSQFLSNLSDTLPNGVKHTSMSVGDIVQIDDQFFICASFGWTKLEF